ncbi:hypothetical protein SAMN05216238_10617 [Lentibacillus persicus]|uniref:DUF3993 domain-containing protein n=1 Tax=Lentibacillus persicus TaxID=640948 RepID=A0A1I1WEI3_9BACI|nr:hypothetical protein [Lentibacillus persicus]SFD93482.1 hypothetical protein SAMN05216238_10617 [Lentibacillus persicus]
MQKKINSKYVSLILGIAFIITTTITLQSTSAQTVLASKYGGDHETSQAVKSKAEVVDKEQLSKELSHEQIVSLTDQFIDTLVQEADEQNRVVNFDTKSALLNEFENISTKEVAAGYVDYYYTEKNEGLYIKPTETPPWFNEHNDYDMIHKDSNTVYIKQENTTDLYGTYTIIFEFKWKADQWYISDISHQ